MKLGILGGTFDPPHNGHLQIARSARDALGLAQIVFMPAKQPPHKLGEPVSPLETRVALVECAIADEPSFVISLLEAKREGPSYTVDTLRELHRELPNDTVIYFIMGLDSLVNLPTWHKPQEIVRLCKLAVLERPGYEVDLDALEEKVPGVKESVVIVRSPITDVSSSEIRERVARGEAIGGMVPPRVEAYIQENGLYKDDAGVV